LDIILFICDLILKVHQDLERSFKSNSDKQSVLVIQNTSTQYACMWFDYFWEWWECHSNAWFNFRSVIPIHCKI